MRTRPSRHILASVLVFVVAAGLVAMAVPAFAQTPFVPYFGKNLVRYDKFDWQIYTTEHFQIYYYLLLAFNIVSPTISLPSFRINMSSSNSIVLVAL